MTSWFKCFSVLHTLVPNPFGHSCTLEVLWIVAQWGQFDAAGLASFTFRGSKGLGLAMCESSEGMCIDLCEP